MTIKTMQNGVSIENDGMTNSLGSKFKTMGISLDKQVEFLNKLYKGMVTFIADYNGCIEVAGVDKSVTILELPNIDNLLFEHVPLGFMNSNVKTIKFPKKYKKLTNGMVSALVFGKVKNIWVYDSTEMNLSSNTIFGLNMIVVRSSTGGKPIIYQGDSLYSLIQD